MEPTGLLDVRGEVAEALRARRPIVALESTVIAQGLPWPINLETARAVEAVIRSTGAVPATIGVLGGRATVGLSGAELEELARGRAVRKASRRDLAAAIAQKATAATTVASSIYLAHLAGIRVFATGGIGGVHVAEGQGSGWDVSGDLHEVARTPVVVICAGAKSILDLAGTLEVLESLGVPVVGYQADEFPAFLVETSGLPVSSRVESPAEAANLLRVHWRLGGAGVVIAQPLPAEHALNPVEFDAALTRAQEQVIKARIRGPAVTPFLLARLAELTEGRSVEANQALLVANATLAAQIARCLADA